MKNFIKSLFLVIISCITVIRCTDNDDQPSSLPIQNFIWKGLNLYYLYQPNVIDLSDSRFSNQKSLDDYLYGFSSPESLFSNLLYDKTTTDKYSAIVSNYVQLEQLLQGTTKSNGVEYGFSYKSGSTTDIFGWVKYVMPNSDASTKAIQRGTIFYAVNGTQLRADNYRTLLSADSYTLNLADYDNGTVTPNNQSVTLTKSSYTENPVLLKNVYTVGAKKVGYLVYNGFYSNFETDLNNAFTYFKGENITDFVLDLRYNGGGSIATATRLGSMITGQFNGQLFASQQWNPKLQPLLNQSSLINNFPTTLGNGASISSINMSTVYVLTTGSTASASELVINCLQPYITVVQIGSKTTGKNVGSVTLYDSPNFRRENANPTHTYAMQPIVLKVVNKNGFGDYQSGIEPTATNLLPENIGNLSQLGNVNEPLLAKALNLATLRPAKQNTNFKIFNEIIDNSERNLNTEMYLENAPEELKK